MKKKILLVEDDLLACRAYQKLLENTIGCQVDCVLDGKEGLEKVHNGYHCVILDLSLPKIDGWEVLKKIKNHDGTKHIPVVVCTVLDGDHIRRRAKELGADGFVNKFNDDLLTEVDRIVGGA